MIDQIVQALKAQLAISLPDYKEVPFFFNPEKNVLGALDKGYFIRVLAGIESPGTLKALTITRDFGITLTREYYGNQLNDTVIFDSVNEALQEAVELYKDIFQTNLNGNVLNVHSLRSNDPIIDNDNKNIQIPIIFSVQYREEI